MILILLLTNNYFIYYDDFYNYSKLLLTICLNYINYLSNIFINNDLILIK